MSTWNKDVQFIQCKVLSKTKRLYTWDQKCLIWVFLGRILKTIVTFEINTLKLAKLQSYIQNKKLWSWEKKCLIWVFLRLDLKKLLLYLKSTPLNLSKLNLQPIQWAQALFEGPGSGPGPFYKVCINFRKVVETPWSVSTSVFEKSPTLQAQQHTLHTNKTYLPYIVATTVWSQFQKLRNCHLRNRKP